MLRQHRFDVIEAGDGASALELAANAQPDLVLLEVNSPDIHGFDVARRLKLNERTKGIPILQISASVADTEHRVDRLDTGADAYLAEPVEPGELVANIRALLRMRDAEAGLQRTMAMLSAVVDASPLAIVVFDRESHIRSWNPAAQRLFGYSAEEMIGRSAEEGPLESLVAAGLSARLARGESATAFEAHTTRKNGNGIDLSVFAAPLGSPGSSGSVALIEDVSARNRYEHERAELLARERDARREAEAASRLKDEFLATLSHELRTPLNAILGWTSILQKGRLDEQHRAHAVDVIERNARSQQQLVDDILEVSRIIRGQLRLELAIIDLVESVRAAVESVRPSMVAKHQTMTGDYPQTPMLVSADRERLQQVFWNVLSNATKYTPRDGRIDVRIAPDSTGVAVVVRDNGIGIAPNVLPHIFERFRQGDAGTTREYGGLGLGLAIVRHLVDAHGGTVRAESNGLGQGSAFTVVLPLASTSQ
jgi:PAS domain S-box-containing protein